MAFQHVNVPVEFERFDISGNTSQDAALFKQSMDSLKRNKVGLKGACSLHLTSSENACSWHEGEEGADVCP
jgi:hypothetical protein